MPVDKRFEEQINKSMSAGSRDGLASHISGDLDSQIPLTKQSGNPFLELFERNVDRRWLQHAARTRDEVAT